MKKKETLLPFLKLPAYQKILKIMKLTCAFLLFACLHVSAGTYSQDRVTLQLKGTDIKKALKTIERKTSYRFLYNENLVMDKHKITLDVTNAEVTAVLDKIFDGSGIGYRVLDNKLVVLKTITGNNEGQIQDIRITGKVLGADGQPLSGVSVTIKGAQAGTTTDAAGNFSITVPDENSVLVFSYVGHETQEVVVGANTTLNISMVNAAATQIEQVVVIGYGTQRKRDLTGSISSIKGEELARMPATNPVSSLQGKVAGLTIVNSGRAGASPTVRIRGVNSTNNTDPLYVVDGVFQTNIDYLNPGDIESIEVLRDPSSIAMFGLQGGNGVIIVTTKRAAKGQTRISLQSSLGVQKVIDKIDVTDAEGFKKLYNAQLANLNAAPFDYTNYTANNNWQDLVFQDAVISNNTLSISNSSEKTTSLFSLGYNLQEGVLKYDEYQKYIARLNHEIRFNSRIRVGADITGFHWKQQNPGADLNNALWAAPIIPIQVDENTYYSTPSFQRAQVSNPIARLNQNDGNSINKGYRFIGSVFAEIKLMSNLTFKSSFYTDLGFNNSRSYTPLPFRFVNLGEGAAKTDTSFNTAARTGVGQSQAEFRKFQQDHTLTFTKTFNSKHNVTALAGFTTLFQGSSTVSGNRTDTLLNIPRDRDFWYLGIANANNPTTNSGGGGEESYMSFLGRVNYSYSGRYLLNATYRRDGSSKFSPDNRWGNFGSIGLGWVISQESFFKDVNFLNFLKLRGAWGTVGSGLGLPSNLYLPGLNTANVGVFGDNVYGSVTPAYVPDPNLHWEVVRGIDVGLDARALRNRLNTEITFYDRTTKDILTTLTLPGTAGNYSYRTNLGTITNRGIEVSLGWNDHIGNDFTYNITSNFSYNKNKVESIGDNINFQILGNAGVNKTETGRSIGYFYGYRQTGIYQAVADLDKIASLSNSLPGDVAYADINGDGIIDSKDRTYLGTPFPAYNFGVNLSLGYKGFDLVLEGQGVAGNKVYTQRRTATFAILNYETNRLNAWTGAGSTNIEPILDNTRANNFLFSTYYLEPGDYFRIRTAQIGYTFSSARLARTPIKQLRVYLSGQNIATFTQTTGYTPEASISDPIASGADNGTYPVPAVYSIGINVTF
jgi:TonB-linked SusC/RagA family outer membrane protein